MSKSCWSFWPSYPVVSIQKKSLQWPNFWHLISGLLQHLWLQHGLGQADVESTRSQWRSTSVTSSCPKGSKEYLHLWLRRFVSCLKSWLSNLILKKLDADIPSRNEIGDAILRFLQHEWFWDPPTKKARMIFNPFLCPTNSEKMEKIPTGSVMTLRNEHCSFCEAWKYRHPSNVVHVWEVTQETTDFRASENLWPLSSAF